MDNDENLIQILNGLCLSDTDDFNVDYDAFNDGNWEPTDPFLEALKSELSVHEQTIEESRRDTNDRAGKFDDVLVRGHVSRPRDSSFNLQSKYVTLLKDKHESDDQQGYKPNSLDLSPERRSLAKSPNYSKPLTRTNAQQMDHVAGSDSIANFSKEELMLETKLKSLELRVLGQLRTIRNLERKNIELEKALRDQHLQTNGRVKVADRPAEPIKGTPRISSAINTAKADKLSVQLEQLQIRLGEEQSRRQRAEDRCKALRDYLETSKVKCIELEKSELNWQQNSQEMQSRLIKYRKECKELMGALGAQRAANVEKESELSVALLRAEKAETGLLQCQSEVESLKYELRTHHTQALTASNRAKQFEIELDLFKEKEAAWRAEKRLLKLSKPTDGKLKTQVSVAARTRSYSPPVDRNTSLYRDPTPYQLNESSTNYLDREVRQQAADLDREVITENLNFIAEQHIQSVRKDSKAQEDRSDVDSNHPPRSILRPWVGAGIRTFIGAGDVTQSSELHSSIPDRDNVGKDSFIGLIHRVNKVKVNSVERQQSLEAIGPAGHLSTNNDFPIEHVKQPVVNPSVRFNKLQDMYTRVVGKRTVEN